MPIWRPISASRENLARGTASAESTRPKPGGEPIILSRAESTIPRSRVWKPISAASAGGLAHPVGVMRDDSQSAAVAWYSAAARAEAIRGLSAPKADARTVALDPILAWRT